MRGEQEKDKSAFPLEIYIEGETLLKEVKRDRPCLLIVFKIDKDSTPYLRVYLHL